MLDTYTQKIKKLYKRINNDQQQNMKLVHKFGTVLNKAREVARYGEWEDFVTDDCGINPIIPARRSMRIARMLTVEQAVEAGSIKAGYLKCREIDKGRGTTQ